MYLKRIIVQIPSFSAVESVTEISKELLVSVLQHSGISSALPLSVYPGLPRIGSVCETCLTVLFTVLNEVFYHKLGRELKGIR